MDSYRIVKPCAHLTADGSALHHRKAGKVVELSDTEAARLGDAVELVGKPKARAREPKSPPADKKSEDVFVAPTLGVGFVPSSVEKPAHGE